MKKKKQKDGNNSLYDSRKLMKSYITELNAEQLTTLLDGLDEDLNEESYRVGEWLIRDGGSVSRHSFLFDKRRSRKVVITHFMTGEIYEIWRLV